MTDATNTNDLQTPSRVGPDWLSEQSELSEFFNQSLKPKDLTPYPLAPQKSYKKLLDKLDLMDMRMVWKCLKVSGSGSFSPVIKDAFHYIVIENQDARLNINSFQIQGESIPTDKTIYEVKKLLGKGGYGAVYQVEDTKTKTLYAMKVERIMERRRHATLRMEIDILKKLGDLKHFTQMVDRGKKEREGYVFLVMRLVGKSLADIKRERHSKIFSFTTGLGVAQQCLEECEALHGKGYIHRDLKPHNYACGLNSKKHMIFLLDFGIARKFTDTNNEIREPREFVQFKGTVRFAALACHKNTEMSPKDDCECWFYLLLDLILTQGLPWHKLTDRSDVMQCKEECRKEKRKNLFDGLQRETELNSILDYIYKLKYQDRVDYNYIYRLLAKASGAKIDAPYDWELEDDVFVQLGNAKLSSEAYSELYKIWIQVPKLMRPNLLSKVACIKGMSKKTLREKIGKMYEEERMKRSTQNSTAD